MIIINHRGRTIFAWQEGDEWLVSPFDQVKDGRRPIARYDSYEEIEAMAQQRMVNVTWQTS